MSEIKLPPELAMLKKYAKFIVLGMVAAFGLFTSVYTVGPEEVGVVTRFGKFDRIVTPGLNFKAPFGVESVDKVPVERQLKQEFGFRTRESGVRSTYIKAGFEDESLMLTGDLNLADVEWVIQYRIVDPYLYLFRVRNAEKTLRDMSESVVRKVVGDRTVNEVLTVGRMEVATVVEGLLQELCNEYQNGIKIDQVVLQDVNPPEQVKPSFNAVNEAQQQRETLINQGQAEFNRVIPRARGEAQQTIQQAEAYALNRVNRALGETERFNALYEEYIKATEVTRTRLYLETMSRVMPNIGTKVIVDENGNNVLPLLQMQTENRQRGGNN
ncbi:MAG: FtsH protease activity modulator HflK [Bacteroidetes bacterium]|nr:FtsH protease activity modulator HflK [Bacteroidota bacterium]MCH8523421.1 FtsH protease activity modulator HflK [Balneolales bacterium]